MNVKPPLTPVKITIEAQLKPSEDPERVLMAIRNLVGGIELTVTRLNDRLIARTENPRALYIVYDRIRARQSLGVARRLLVQNASEDSTWIYFNKQAAYVKTINICEDEAGSPLGPLKMTIHSPEPMKIIDWLAPQQPD